MATIITPSNLETHVVRNSVCFTSPGTEGITNSGFLVVAYQNRLEVARFIEDLQGDVVEGATVVPCAGSDGSTTLNCNPHGVIFLRDRRNNRQYYSLSVQNPLTGLISVVYYNLDGTQASDLTAEDYGFLVDGRDMIDFVGPSVFCLNGSIQVSRIDMFDSSAPDPLTSKLGSIWLDEQGAVVPAPNGELHAGSCALPVDVEIEKVYHSIPGSPGYVTVYRAQVYAGDTPLGEPTMMSINPTTGAFDMYSAVVTGAVFTGEIPITPVVSHLQILTPGQLFQVPQVNMQSLSISTGPGDILIDTAFEGTQTLPQGYSVSWTCDEEGLTRGIAGIISVLSQDGGTVVTWTTKVHVFEVPTLSPLIAL